MAMKRPKSLPAPFFDSAVAGMAEAFISHIQLVINFDRQLDPDRMARACRLLLDAEPVLGCLYRSAFFSPFWDRLPKEELDSRPVFRFADEKSNVTNEETIFLGERITPQRELPVKVLLARHGEADRLVIKADHQVADAAGVKYMGRRLADIYNRLETDSSYRPESNNAPRGQNQIYRSFLPGHLPAFALRYARDIKAVFYPIGNLTFPMGRKQSDAPIFVLKRFESERVERARAYAARHGATINDLAMAAMFRALASAVDWNGRSTLRMVGTVDMRRYLQPGKGEVVGNLSGWYFLNLRKDLGRDLRETLNKLKRLSRFIKKDYIGLGFNLFGYMILRPIPYRIRTWYMNQNIKLFNRVGNMPPTLTNMGRIDHKSLVFRPAEVVDAFLLVPPTTPPVLGMGLSGCRGSLTLSSGIFESAVPRVCIEDLFEHFDRELPT